MPFLKAGRIKKQIDEPVNINPDDSVDVKKTQDPEIKTVENTEPVIETKGEDSLPDDVPEITPADSSVSETKNNENPDEISASVEIDENLVQPATENLEEVQEDSENIETPQESEKTEENSENDSTTSENIDEDESEKTEQPGEESQQEIKKDPPDDDVEPKYDFTSGERYVDKISTKTEFDKMLDELAAISKDLLEHEVEKFAKKFTGKFQGDFEKAESDAKKYEAFLGGYITNAAMTLYDNGYIDAAIKQLDSAKNVIEMRKKLEVETEAIKERVVEENAAVDLSDILGMFGDG